MAEASTAAWDPKRMRVPKGFTLKIEGAGSIGFGSDAWLPDAVLSAYVILTKKVAVWNDEDNNISVLEVDEQRKFIKVRFAIN